MLRTAAEVLPVDELVDPSDPSDEPTSSVPPETVVPFGRVPLRTMVLVPLTSATVTRVWFKLAYVPSPMMESKNVVLPLSSQPQGWYSKQRHVTGLVSLTPSSDWREKSLAKSTSLVGVVV